MAADDEVQRAAEVLLGDYVSEYDAGHLSWQDFADQARRILDAAERGRSALDTDAINSQMSGKRYNVQVIVTTEGGTVVWQQRLAELVEWGTYVKADIRLHFEVSTV